MRLSLALEQGAVSLPGEGRILLMRPPADADLPPMPPARLAIHQPFKPAADALGDRGIVDPMDVPAVDGGAVIYVPRSKRLARDLVARAVAALPEGAPVVVDGDKADGVESLLRACRGTFAVGDVFSKAHGKTFSFPAPAAAPDGWLAPPERVEGWTLRAGVFSADGPDPGSVMLARALPPLKGTVCDLGAGWGYLSVRLLAASPEVTACELVEADHDALLCAEANVTDDRAGFAWADATAYAGGPFDAVVCNPPFHPSRKADPGLGRAFIATAARNLAPRGRAWFVANRHLPYEAALRDAFAEVVVRAEGGGYKVVEAARPVRRRR